MSRGVRVLACAFSSTLSVACGSSSSEPQTQGGAVAIRPSTLVCELQERAGPPAPPPETQVADFGPPIPLGLNDPCFQDAVEVSPDGNRIYHFYQVNLIEVLEADDRLFAGTEVRFQDRAAGDTWRAPETLDLAAALPGSGAGETRVAPDGSWVVWHAAHPSNLGYVEGLPPGQTFDLDVYEATIIDGRFGRVQHLPAPVNSAYLDGEQWLTADGLTMYFASSRPGGAGGLDIWVTTHDASGVWSQPQPLPAPVNSSSDDLQPTLSPDGQWLYFASDRDGAMSIYRVAVTGGSYAPTTEVVIAAYAGEPSFSDDGRLFFVHVEIDFSVDPPVKYDSDIYYVEPTG